MVVNGKAVAAAIYDEVRSMLASCKEVPTLAIISCDPQGPSKRYITLKERQAKSLGITALNIELPITAATEAVAAAITEAEAYASAIVVQLPLPPHIDTAAVLASIPVAHDVDALHYDGADEELLPPVLGAILAIASVCQYQFLERQIVVLGEGRLVGKPFLTYAKAHSLAVTLITETTPNPKPILQSADVIISGVGKPGLVQSEDIKEGVAIFDAGTSEVGGVLAGDADPKVAEKAFIFTPVPGGIGPVTMAVLFRNSVLLKKRQEKNMI